MSTKMSDEARKWLEENERLEARVAALRAVTDDLQTVFDEHVDDEINVSWIRKKLESLDA